MKNKDQKDVNIYCAVYLSIIIIVIILIKIL